MKFDTGLLGSHFILEKGISYKGDELVESCEVGLVTLDSFRPGGGYKTGSEKPFDGGFKPSFVLAPGDVVIATTDVTQDGAVLCAPALIPNYEDSFSELVWSLDVAKLLPTTGDVRPEYLYNFLRIPLNRKRAAYGDTGTTVRRIPFDAMYEQVIPIPSIEEQDRINSFIATLDRKIELNTAMATTLERIAQSLFRSWFVDFDPVKAKMAGEKPVGMDDDTAALFPDSIEDSELGLIPQGWSVREIGDEVDLVGGSTPSTSNKEYWDGDICWTTPRDLSRQIGCITLGSERKITAAGLRKISSGILPIHSVLMSSRAPIGYLSINAVPTAINQGFIALPQTDRFPSLFLMFWLNANMNEIESRAGGATFAEISKTSFRTMPFVLPDEKVLGRFGELTRPVLEKLVAISRQSAELVQLRETVLPQLVSGELRIPEEDLVL